MSRRRRGILYLFTSGAGNPPATETLMGNAVPAMTGLNDGQTSITVGLFFKVTTAGKMTGVRFYKTVESTGTHTWGLFDAGNNLVASGQFTGETASGWQTQAITPIDLTPNSNYIVAILCPDEYYVTTGAYFTSVVTSGHIESVSPGGLFDYNFTTISEPTQSFNNGAYFVDLEFQPS